MESVIEIREEDLGYLRRAGCPEWVVNHCIAVTRKALEIADSLKICVDLDLIKDGALNHDIGRAMTQSIMHAVVGAGIAEEAGMDDRVVRIIERHIGAGIPREETEELGLPYADFVPFTPEEVIVAYTDNLFDGDRERSYDESLEIFRNKLWSNHPAVKRFMSMHRTICSWKE